jgi:UDP-2,3-diacylglucosamine pyrophosphatase LpxH
MWFPEDVIVVSDLHLAAERDRGLFRADVQLAGFFKWIHESCRHCHLFLNGDVFDFLVYGEDTGILDIEKAGTDATAIIEHHKDVFKDLRSIANSSEHQLTIISGNHDPELTLSSVQNVVEHHLNSSCTHSPVRWLTEGQGALVQLGEARILIEHGDQYDSWNWIDYEALRKVVCLASRNVSYADLYHPPPGSFLVLKRFNRIREQFPWLSTLQPLTPSILPLALEVILPQISWKERYELIKAVEEFRDFGRRSITDDILRTLKPDREYWDDLDKEKQSLSKWLAEYNREEDGWKGQDESKSWIKRAIVRLRNRASQALLKRFAERAAFLEITTPDENHEAVKALLSKGTDLVIHGHTHSAKAYPIDKGLYFNSGTWGEISMLPGHDETDDKWTNYLKDLKEGRTTTVQRPTFVRISNQQGKTLAGLFEWENSKSKPLSTWSFHDHEWRKEDNAWASRA